VGVGLGVELAVGVAVAVAVAAAVGLGEGVGVGPAQIPLTLTWFRRRCLELASRDFNCGIKKRDCRFHLFISVSFLVFTGVLQEIQRSLTRKVGKPGFFTEGTRLRLGSGAAREGSTYAPNQFSYGRQVIVLFAR
jgi:hypothetical protein